MHSDELLIRCTYINFLSVHLKTWDSSRVSAAIPSGVGFLGSGLIIKHSEKDEFGESLHAVKGLTTATSIWLSAAVGIACGGGLYFAGFFSTLVAVVMIRFGPRPARKGGDDSGRSAIDETSALVDGVSKQGVVKRKRSTLCADV